jgi:hypothetical protein
MQHWRMQHWRPALSPDFAAAARAYAVDVAGAVFLFVAASLTAGRVWRFPFDDEIYTLSTIERMSPLELLALFPARFDVHPPLSYLLFSGLQHLGAGASGMRLASLAMTALALALFHLSALTWMARGREPIQLVNRLIALVLFGLCPLAVSQGDALRWYPLFAALFALFVTLYLAGRNDAARLCSAVALGLAASTNLLAGPVALAFALYRYALQKRFAWRFDTAFWLITLAAGSLSVYSAGALLFARFGQVGSQLGNGILRAVLTDALGFFGGDALGLGQAWIVVPALAIGALALYASSDRKRPSAPVHLLLLMLAAAALTIVPGFAKPRSFLYLAPVMTLLVVIYLDGLLRRGQIGRALAATAVLAAVNVAAIANISHNDHPFKRNAVIPYQSILDFIGANGSGQVLVVSTDPVIPWMLNHRAGAACASYFFAARNCLGAGARYDSVILVRGHSDKSASAATMRKFGESLAPLIAGRQKIATMQAGHDEDAALKSRLTGVALDAAILTVDLYR